ncbi:MAG: TonB-dependent receptor [Gammaproteobacteria bacterium]|nr:TonB-dependent receptor [Gammaproteobacteria bacterium]
MVKSTSDAWANRVAGAAFSCLLALLSVSLPVKAGANPLPDDLTSMSLEALMDIEVTSVSKKPQKHSEAAAAIFVISNDDLRRWGVTTLPDALRRVPGLQVARIDANKWAITARGFNSRFANKLLVMIDGRSVYTPLFAGVYWESHDVPLEDIERIEVIRGPGGTLWGANAVNGVINIITRQAGDTPGTLVSAGAGNEERGFGSVRHGGRLNNGADYRVYAKHSSRDAGGNSTGAHDDWELGQIGFRSDWDRGERDSFTLQGDYYDGKAGEQVHIASGPLNNPPATFVGDTGLSGGNLLFRWQRVAKENSEFALQAYIDHVKRDEIVLHEDRDIFDVDFQHHLSPVKDHDMVWGIGYRHTRDATQNNATFSLDPSTRSVDLFSAFVQDEISLTPDLRLTLGSKFEHNDFTGTEVQPNLRISWLMDDSRTLWGAVSRTVRTPARGEHDVTLRLLPPPAQDPGVPLYAVGNAQFESENLTAYELGYRVNHENRWSLDLAAFYNEYDELRTLDPASMSPADILMPFANRMDGETYGIELAAQWQIRRGWDMHASYSHINTALHLVDGSSDSAAKSGGESTPQQQAAIWSSVKLGRDLEFDAALRHVDDISVNRVEIDSYTELDLRLGWRPRTGIEISLTGQNLLDNQHTEFLPDFIATQPTAIERSIHVKGTLEF